MLCTSVIWYFVDLSLIGRALKRMGTHWSTLGWRHEVLYCLGKFNKLKLFPKCRIKPSWGGFFYIQVHPVAQFTINNAGKLWDNFAVCFFFNMISNRKLKGLFTITKIFPQHKPVQYGNGNIPLRHLAVKWKWHLSFYFWISACSTSNTLVFKVKPKPTLGCHATQICPSEQLISRIRETVVLQQNTPIFVKGSPISK